jgi:NADH-quinone oxidoreductase subunit M
MVILGSMKENFWIAFIAATTLILGASYSLWLIKRVFYGDVGNSAVAKLSDINSREFLILGALASLIILVGVYPKIISDITNSSVLQFIELVSFSKVGIL